MEATSDFPERCNLYRFRDGEHRPTCEAARAEERMCGGDGRFFVASRESIEEENTYLKALNGRLLEIIRRITHRRGGRAGGQEERGDKRPAIVQDIPI